MFGSNRFGAGYFGGESESEFLPVPKYGDGSYGQPVAGSATYGPVSYTYGDLAGHQFETFVDTFSRVVGSGWGTFEATGVPPYNTRPAWQTSTNISDWTVDGTQGKIALPAARTAYARTFFDANTGVNGPQQGATGQVLAKVSVDNNTGVTDALPNTIGVLGAYNGSGGGAGWLAAIRYGTNAFFELHLVKNGDSLQRYARVAIASFDPTKKYWIRLNFTNVNSRSVQAKVWQEGTTEPSTWQIVAEYVDTDLGGNTFGTLSGIFVGSEQSGRGVAANYTVEDYYLFTPATTSYLTIGDSGTGTEVSNLKRTVTDSGTGSDAKTLKVVLSRTDSGTGSDTAAEHVFKTVTETSVSVDQVTVEMQIDQETGTTADAVLLEAEYDTSDSGASSDSATVSTTGGSTPVSGTDTGHGTDTGTLHPHIFGFDTGSSSIHVGAGGGPYYGGIYYGETAGIGTEIIDGEGVILVVHMTRPDDGLAFDSSTAGGRPPEPVPVQPIIVLRGKLHFRMGEGVLA